MDMNILLALQDFRNGAGSFLTDFFVKMTFLGELNTVIVIMALIYWSVSKELGTYLLMGWSGNRLVNGAMKVTACAYRPWIRDARILPYGNSMTTATGYSFPSGHTMNAATVFGGGALRKEFSRALRIVLGLMVLLVGFSRSYLAGRHCGGHRGDVAYAASHALDRGAPGEGPDGGRHRPAAGHCRGGVCLAEGLSRGL